MQGIEWKVNGYTGRTQQAMTGITKHCPQATIDTALVRAMLAPDVAVAMARPVCVDEALYAEEIAYLADAVPLRRAEFGTARLCARRALAELGFAPQPLVPNADRSPVWPPGVRGSITHGSGWCVVAATAAPHIVGLGIDVEDDAALDPALEALVCTEAERGWLDRRPPAARGLFAKLIFSAKESMYKAQYPLTGAWLDFHDVVVRIEPAAASFAIVELRKTGPHRAAMMRAAGRFHHAGGTIVTTAVVSAAS